MKLLVDAVPFDGGKSGISAYCRGVVKALSDAGHELTLVVENAEVGKELRGLIRGGSGGEKDIIAPSWTRRAVFSMLWHLFLLPRKVKKSGCDACLMLAANRRAMRKYPIQTLAVVHDLSQYHVEAKYDAFRMFYIKSVLPFFVRRAHRVVAISKSTRQDLIRYWKVPESKISVVYNGFDGAGGKAEGGKGRSILYISRIEHPGKNHINLIRAYEQLPREVAAAHPLVLVGGDWNGAEAVHKAAEASSYREFIRFAGFVPLAEIGPYWRDAAVYAFPSRFEGFGLSLLEAMDRGVGVCCSKTSSLGELGEGVAELFDPESPEEIAAALVKLLSSDNTERIAAGRARAAEFSWAKCAAGLLNAFPAAEVFGVRIDCETMDAALDRIGRCMAKGPEFFAFVNAHCLNIAYRDEPYRNILNRCAAVWPDGTGVRVAGRRLGFPVPENVNGTDMFPLLCERAVKDGRTMFFFGSRPGVADKAAENAKKSHPGLKVAGTCDGFTGDEEVIRRINAVKPDILLVALGVPRQEKWIAANLAKLDCGAVIAVGGLLDFVSGRIPRAPGWMRRMGIEWIYRLYQEPVGKFRRYVFGNPLFLYRVGKQVKRK